MTKYNNKFINNINCYILGRAISSFGTQIYNFILALYILKITGTALTFAITLVLSIIPRIILGPIAGILVDRLDRKKIIVITDILCGIIMLLLYLYMLNHNINIILTLVLSSNKHLKTL
ncbi:MFS transporter [Hathewaya limosa]|uniref:MFS family permease n=1 Tax=Hathewaya limosa TaxID=1536 RepID=A0ABU0JUN5_HATLI|nr:MFS transporter [Hathewaya limosa]MDQ0479769.1 MFS family permease [Hathewaya limosa]